MKYTYKIHKRLYDIWNNMKQRCYNINNSSYKWYGAKGIKVCDEWLNDFQTFAEWAYSNGYYKQPKELSRGDKLCISRNGDIGNYDPNNCKFILQRKNVIEANIGRIVSDETRRKKVYQ